MLNNVFNRFLEDYNVASVDFAMNRLLYYTLAQTYKVNSFLPRVINSHFVYLSSLTGLTKNILKSKM
jgi:hypothetical protein